MNKKSSLTIDDLRSVYLFQDITMPQLVSIVPLFDRRFVEQGRRIIQDGTDTSNVYFVLSGQLRVEADIISERKFIFRMVSQGEMIGDYAAIDGQSRTASVIAAEDCDLAVISATKFNQLLEDFPAIARAEIEILVESVRNLTTRLYSQFAYGSKSRLAAMLVQMAKPDEASQQLIIDAVPSQNELAAMTGTHREAVNRTLREFEKADMIKRSGRSIIITDSQALIDFE